MLGGARGAGRRLTMRNFSSRWPLDAIQAAEPNAMTVILHLNDAASTGHQDYRREWNGVLRLYNLLQFLPNSWWTTTLGVKRDLYPEFASVDTDLLTPAMEPWEQAISLAATELAPTMRSLAAEGDATSGSRL